MRNPRKSLIPLAGMILLTVLGTTVLGANWSTPILISDAADFMKAPAVAGAASGGAHVKWNQKNEAIKYRRVYADGTLGPITVVHSGSFCTGGDITEALNGDIWITWEDWTGTDGARGLAARSVDGGSTWTNHVVAEWGFGGVKFPQLAKLGTTGGSIIYASWRSKSNLLYYRVWDGSGWGALTRIPDTYVETEYWTTGLGWSPQDGFAYKVYGEDIGDGDDVWFREFNGSGWSAASRISSDGKFFAFPAVAGNEFGQRLVIWDRDNRVRMRFYDPAVGWHAPQILAYDARLGKVTYIPDRKEFYVTYNETDDNEIGGKYVVDGVVGTKDTPSSGLSGLTFAPDDDVSADGNGRVHTVFEGWTGNGPFAYYCYTDEFVPDVVVPPPPAYRATVISTNLPESIVANETASGSITFRNSGSAAWDSNTRLATSDPRGRNSVVYNSADWISASRLTSVNGGTCAPGQDCVFSFVAQAPATAQSLSEGLELLQEGVEWFADPSDNLTWNVEILPREGYIGGFVKDLNGNPVTTTGNNAQAELLGTSRTSSTNAEGWYDFDNVAEGTYSVRVTANGYQTKQIDDIVVLPQEPTFVSFNLAPANPGSIIGNVTDDCGAVLSNLAVDLSNGCCSTTTDVNGDYTLSDIPGGTYSVVFTKGGYASTTIDNVSVTTGLATTLDATLEPLTGTISGTLQDSCGRPLNDAEVTTSLSCRNYSGTTSPDGTYSMEAAPGTYTLTAMKTGYANETVYNVTVTAESDSTVNFQLVPTAVGTISGQVTDCAGTGIASAVIETVDGCYGTTTDSGGNYSLSNVGVGTYDILVSATDFVSSTEQGIVVTNGQATSLNVTLTPITEENVVSNGDMENGSFAFWGGDMPNGWGATYRGTFEDADWAVINVGGANGNVTRLSNLAEGFEAGLIQQISGLTPGAEVTFTADAYQFDTGTNVWIAVDGNGNIALPARNVHFDNVAGQWNAQSVSATVGSSGTVTAFIWAYRQWGSGADVYIDIAELIVPTVGASSGAISGVVEDASNNPVLGATVQTDAGQSATTASDGSYTIVDVPAGTYAVTASAAGYNSSQQNGVSVATCATTTAVDFNLSASGGSTEKLANGDMEGGFWPTGWGSGSALPNEWDGWVNPGDFNCFDETTIVYGGAHSARTTISAGGNSGDGGYKRGFYQQVTVGANADFTITVWARHTNGNCPSIVAWNPDNDTSLDNAYNAGRYKWVTTDNWGQANQWVSNTLSGMASSSGNITVFVGGAHHGGGGVGTVYVDEVSVTVP